MILAGVALAFLLKRLCLVFFVEYDRSALVRIDVGPNAKPEDFSNCPILNGPLPFATYDNKTIPNVRTDEVVGFIVGTPTYIEDPDNTGLKLWEKGHYAYITIHWEKCQEVKRLVNRGFSLQNTYLPDEEGRPRMSPETRFLRFTTGSVAQQGVADIKTGIWAPFRYQPYKRQGFPAYDLDYRQMTPQTRMATRIARTLKRIKERENA